MSWQVVLVIGLMNLGSVLATIRILRGPKVDMNRFIDTFPGGEDWPGWRKGQ